MKKTAGALALAVTLSMALATPAFAETKVEMGSVDKAGTTNTTITGTIKPTTLTVTVPTTVAFEVDPGAEPSTTLDENTKKAGQFTNPSNFTIINNSVVDVYAYVSAVNSVDKAALVTSEQSVAPKEGDTAAKIMVGVKSTAPTDFSTAADWLKSDMGEGEKYYAFNAEGKGKLAAKDETNASQTDNQATMYVFGQVSKTGWTVDDTFTVVPTFTITVNNPEPTPAA